MGAVIEPSALVLTELADGSAYHFDMRRPLELPEIVEEARAQELQHTEVETEQHVGPWPRHPDHDLAEE